MNNYITRVIVAVFLGTIANHQAGFATPQIQEKQNIAAHANFNVNIVPEVNSVHQSISIKTADSNSHQQVIKENELPIGPWCFFFGCDPGNQITHRKNTIDSSAVNRNESLLLRDKNVIGVTTNQVMIQTTRLNQTTKL